MRRLIKVAVVSFVIGCIISELLYIVGGQNRSHPEQQNVAVNLYQDGIMTFAVSNTDVRVFYNPSFIFQNNQQIIITDSKGSHFEYQFEGSVEAYQDIYDRLNEWKYNIAGLP